MSRKLGSKLGSQKKTVSAAQDMMFLNAVIVWRKIVRTLDD